MITRSREELARAVETLHDIVIPPNRIDNALKVLEAMRDTIGRRAAHNCYAYDDVHEAIVRLRDYRSTIASLVVSIETL
jgi:hypothetical protein